MAGKTLVAQVLADRLTASGLHVKNTEALEHFEKIASIVVDKTGTPNRTARSEIR